MFNHTGYSCARRDRGVLLGSDRCWLWLCLIAMLLTALPALAQTGRARHQRLFIVPRPGPITIDGRFDDWDRSGQIWIYVVKQTSAMRSAKLAMMYDDDALYIGAQVRDTTPLMNRHAPEADARNAWDADACQVRIVLDPQQGYPVTDSSKKNRRPNDQLAHLLLWQYTDRQEANLQILYGMTYDLPKAGYRSGVIPRDKFEAAYRRADDGQGYTFEYRIPWTTLEAKNPPKSGDLVAGIVQILWSRPDGIEIDGHAGAAYDVMSKAGFPWQSAACWGKFIFAPQGNLPTSLVEQGVEVEPPLPLTFTFNMPREAEASVTLFDQANQAVRVLVAQSHRPAGKVVEQWDGLDESGQPLPPGQYTWRGVYFDPITTRFVMSVHNSGDPPYRTDDNTGGWGGDHGVPTAICTTGGTTGGVTGGAAGGATGGTTGGGAVVMAWDVTEAGRGIIRTDLSGKKRWGSKFSAMHLVSDGRRIFSADDRGFETHDAARVLDVRDGRPLAFTDTGTVSELPTGGNRKTNLVTGLAYHDGKLFVALRRRNLIAVNDATTGKLLETWPIELPGRLAARSDGSLVAISGLKVVVVTAQGVQSLIDDIKHIDQPAGVAIGPDGRIYVANHGKLQNVSVFDAHGQYIMSIAKRGGRPRMGRFEHDGMLKPGGIAVDAKGKLWVPESVDAPKRISVWNTQTGKLLNEFYGASAYATYVSMDPKHPDEVLSHNVIWKIDLDKGTWRPYTTIWRSSGGNSIGNPTSSGYVGRTRIMTARNGRQFAWGGVNYGNILFMRDGDTFKPIAGVINVVRIPRFEAIIPPSLADAKKFPRGYYLWQDANDDQAVQADEVVAPPLSNGIRGFNWVDADLNVWCEDGFVLRPVRFDGDRPIYDLSQREPTPFKGNNGGFTSLWVDPNDQSVYLLNPGAQPGLGRWTAKGEPMWSYRHVVTWQQSINLPPLTPGKLYGPTMPLGVAGNFTGVATYFGPFHLFTRDGLYVAMLFRDLRLGGLTADTLTAEAFSGELVKPDGMERYFLLAGDQDGRISEVMGLNTVKPLAGGSLTISPQDANVATTALAQYERRKASGQSLTVVRGAKSLRNAKRIKKIMDDRRQFTAAIAYDPQNLYVSFDVTAPQPWVTAIADPKLLFKGGNVLDIQLATDPTANPKRKKPVAGDVRLLVSRHKGKTVAVLYRPKVRSFKGKPIVMTSPTGSESFDRIEVVSDAIMLKHQPRSDGFTVVVTIPLKLVGLALQSGKPVRMDVGYIYGNKTGTQAAARSYWHNNSFSANVINDIPNESRLEPAQWGSVIVE